MNFTERYTQFLTKRKVLVIILWAFIASLLIGIYAGNFLNVTNDDFSAPKGTDAYEANQLIKTYFPEKENELTHIIVMHNPDGGILSTELEIFTQAISDHLFAEYGSILVQTAGYYIFESEAVDFLKYEFVSEDMTTSIITYRIEADITLQQEIAHDMRVFVASIEPNSFQAYTVGQAELQNDTDESIERDMTTIDAIVIPLVFIALAILLRNWRYFPITSVPIFLTIAMSFGILERYIILTDATIQSFVPSVLISLTLGIGVDYNLFLLTRFREERLNGKTVEQSVQKMLQHAGHTIFTSGVTLIIAIAALAFFPITILSSVGIAISVSITVLLAMNLTFTPALLLLIGGWVEKTPRLVVHEETGNAGVEKSKFDKSMDKQNNRSFWYRIGKFSTRRNYVIIVGVLLLTLPLSFQILNSSPQNQIAFFSPRNSESADGFDLLQENFGPGSIGPTNLIVVPQDGIWSENTFSAIQAFILESIATTSLTSSSFQSHTYLGGQLINQTEAVALTTPGTPAYDSFNATVYRFFSTSYVSSDIDGTTAALVEIIFTMDPAGQEAKDLLDQLIVIASGIFDNSFTFGFAGYTAGINAILDTTFDLFPLMILFVIIGIYALVGIMFRSVLLPARLIATIALTMSFIYGSATVVFEYDTFLNDIFPVLDGISVTFWMVPVMSFSIILGLGIDYDIFTIERIKENIWNGMDNDEAIAEGIDKTARIITGAGVIMMIAFGGMMFSSSYILIQFGFVLSFSVLLDTFVVRTLLVPAIMSFGEKLNWWPNLPPHLKE